MANDPEKVKWLTFHADHIEDRCPSCGAKSLFLGVGGWLTCSVLGCKSPGVTEAFAALRQENERLARERDQACEGESIRAQERDEALSRIPTVPHGVDPDKLILNAYGRRCHDEGCKQAEARVAALEGLLWEGRVLADHALVSLDPECGKDGVGKCGENCELRRKLHKWIQATRIDAALTPGGGR